MPREYIPVTPDIEMQVVAYKSLHPLSSYGEIGEALDMSARQVSYILTDLPRLRRINKPDLSESSTKQRILGVLDAVGTLDTPTELRRVLGRADDNHNLVHLLHALRKEGKVEFSERGGSKEPYNIKLTARGKGQGLKPKEAPMTAREVAPDAPAFVQERIPERISESEATADAPNDVNASAPGPEAEAYPLLDALLERERERLDRDAKAMAYINAAEALADVDPEMARALTEKANDFNASYPSPLEAEYLRYAASR